MGASAFTASLVLWRTLERRLSARDESATIDSRKMRSDHLRYARWAAGTSLLGWGCSNVHYLILNASAGLMAVGAMRALDNTLTPYLQGLTALTQLTLPMASAAAARSQADLSRFTVRLGAAWTAMAVVAYVVLAIFGQQLIHTLYGDGFAGVHENLTWYALMLIPYSLSAALLIACKALSRSDLAFWYSAIYAGLLTTGYIFFAKRGMEGIIAVNIAAQALGAPVLFLFLSRASKRH
jgi:O-antigen/teichoic acid export membrane protein